MTLIERARARRDELRHHRDNMGDDWPGCIVERESLAALDCCIGIIEAEDEARAGMSPHALSCSTGACAAVEVILTAMLGGNEDGK